MTAGFLVIVLPIILVLIVVASIYSKRWEKKWQQRQQAKAESAETAAQHKSALPQEVTDTMQRLQQQWQDQAPKLKQMMTNPASLLGAQTSGDLPVRFLAWADVALVDEPDLRDWLHAVPEDGLRVLTQNLSQFCSNIGIELDWLVNHWLDVDGQLSGAAKRIVAAYCRACYNAVVIYPDIQALQPYLAWKAAPTDKANRQFGMRLYTQLVEAGMVAPAPPDALAADEAARWQYVLGAIDQAANANPARFELLVRETVRSQAAPPTAGVGQPQPAGVGQPQPAGAD